ncbi:MAG TPA: pyridoxine 5'-phosphate synthase [Ramlibacter sp.]|nr:pyridoxine 5'-phosphate synthase [Ramlibacter sp.]
MNLSLHKTALSVNLNKVALVRNTRHLGIPSVTRAATLCLEAGAAGITVHPRPDARHIRSDDVKALHELLRAWPKAEYNIEGNPFHNLMDFVRDLRPHQCTLVPDSEGQFTSDHGWNLPADADRLRPVIAQATALGVRVSLFMDPVPEAMAHAKAIGADRVELYTESYASAWGTPRQAEVLRQFSEAARAAQAAGLEVNAGHDLSRENLTDFLRAVPAVREVSIGHALVSDALELGYAGAIKGYLQAIDRAFDASQQSQQ